MKLSVDTETALIERGLLAPPLACVSWANEQLGSGLHHVRTSRKFLEAEILPEGRVIVGANFAYDAAVICAEFPELMPEVFKKYGRGEIRDVQLDQQLIDIARGELKGYKSVAGENEDGARYYEWTAHEYSLAALYLRAGFGVLEKDEFRFGYGALIDKPLDQWQKGAIRYAELDAVATMRVHLWQEASAPEFLVDSVPQARAAFVLHLISCRGLRTDGAACRALSDALEVEIERCKALCKDTSAMMPDKKGRSALVGLLVEQEDGTWKKSIRVAQSLMEARCLELGIQRRITKTGLKRAKAEKIPAADLPSKFTSVDRVSCKLSLSPVLRAYSTFGSANTLRKKVERLKEGERGPLQMAYRALVETGRVSGHAPQAPLIGDNFLNLGRSGLTTDEDTELPGIRSCFVPREGYYLCSVDLDNAEMRAQAQICIWAIGYSILADALNAGQDCHLSLAAHKLGLSYADAKVLLKAGDKQVELERQFMKIPNFSLLGGAGWRVMVTWALNQGIVLSEEQAQELYALFHAKWTEMRPYHRLMQAATEQGLGTFSQYVSGRIRGRCSFTQICNTGFQGLTGCASKAALLPIAYEMYCDRDSALYGSYPVLYVYDEVIAEVPIDRAHDAGYRLAELMAKPWNEHYTPDVKMTCEPALMRRLAKGAKTAHDAAGRLIPYEDARRAA